MHFQLFIAHANGQNPQMLVDVGLADLVSGAEFMDCMKAGPADARGVLICWRKSLDHRNPAAARVGYYPEQQTWIPAVPSEDLPARRYWVGLWNDSAPTPKHLQRAYQINGNWVTLGDGQQWLIPEARELPHDVIRGDDGSWKFVLDRQYHAYGRESERLRRHFASVPDQWNWNEVADFAEQSLRINYRMPPELVSHLRLFTTSNLMKVLVAVWSATLQKAEG